MVQSLDYWKTCKKCKKYFFDKDSNQRYCEICQENRNKNKNDK